MANIIDGDMPIPVPEGEEPPAVAAAPSPSRPEPASSRRKNKPRPEPDHRRRLTVVSGVCAALAVAGIGVGAWQASIAQGYIDAYERDLVEVASSASDVAAGSVIEPGSVQTVEVPRSLLPSDYVAADDAASLEGHRAIANLTAGTPISASCVQATPAAGTITAAVSEGKVAYMIALDGASSMSPLLKVGDEVDIITGGDGQDSRVFAEGIRILALDGSLSQQASSEGSGYSTVTLELTEAQATELHTISDVSGGAVKLVAPPAAELE